MKAKIIVTTLLEDIMGNSSLNGGSQPEPEKQKTTTIGTIFKALPPGVDQECLNIMNQETDTIAMAKKLKVVLRPHEAALATVGIIPDYFAYMLVHVAQQQRGIQ